MLLAVARHEPWFDEAHSWLLATRLGAADLLAHYLRYEGTPGLWHLILRAAASLGLGYERIGFLSAASGILGVCLFLRYAPFPLWLRLLFPFGFFPVFQYSVVARSYSLFLPLLCGLAALFPLRARRFGWYCLLLAVLANVSVHGTAIAAVLAAEWLCALARDGGLRDARAPRAAACAGALGVVFACLCVQLWPPADHGFVPLVVQPQRVWLAVLQIDWAFFGRVTPSWLTVLSVFVFIFSVAWFAERSAVRLYLALATNSPQQENTLLRRSAWCFLTTCSNARGGSTEALEALENLAEILDTRFKGERVNAPCLDSSREELFRRSGRSGWRAQSSLPDSVNRSIGHRSEVPTYTIFGGSSRERHAMNSSSSSGAARTW